jgi:hypothetical protein
MPAIMGFSVTSEVAESDRQGTGDRKASGTWSRWEFFADGSISRESKRF